TGPCATNGCPNIIGTIWTMYNASPRSGCGPTITRAQIWLWADLPQNSGSPWPRSLPTAADCYKWGITHSKPGQSMNEHSTSFQPSDGIPTAEVWATLVRNWVLILGAVAIAVALGIALVSWLAPAYEARAQFRLGQVANNGLFE